MLRCRKLRVSKLLNRKFPSLYTPVGAIWFEEAKPMYILTCAAVFLAAYLLKTTLITVFYPLLHLSVATNGRAHA